MLLFGITCIHDPLSLPVVFAHTTHQFGNITLEVGWSTEPPLVDEMNDVIISVNKQTGQTNDTLGSNLTPVRNALSEMNIMIKYGGITKQLNFVPSAETAGLYESNIIPSRIGSYDLVLDGTIQGQNITTTVPVEDIEGKQKLTFPPLEENGGNANAQNNAGNTIIGSNLQGILSNLDNGIRTNADNMSILYNNTQNLQGLVNEQDNYKNILYLIAVTSMGIAIGAILISGVSLSRKKTAK